MNGPVLCAAVLLAVLPSAPLSAQDSVPPADGDTPANQNSEPSVPFPSASPEKPPAPEILGPDGEPLTGEALRRVQELLKQNPSAIQALPQTRGNTPAKPADGSIVVTGQKPRGSVRSDIPATQTLNPLDIRAYGAASIGELLDALGPQVGSNQGRGGNEPIVLLNGKRVSSFREIAAIPTEAIERTEIFPEELALAYGFPADQKVVNIVTFENFNSVVGQFSFSLPTEGGWDQERLTANYLRINNDTRINVDAEYIRSGTLLESERGVVQIDQSANEAAFRSLLPESDRFAVNGTISGDWLGGVSSTVNGRFETDVNISLLGLGNGAPLMREFETDRFHLGITSSGRIARWSWGLTANYDRASSRTLTDSLGAQASRDKANAVNAISDADLLFNGSLFKLPAGPVSVSLRTAIELRDFDSSSVRSDALAATTLTRDVLFAQGSIDLPLFRRDGAILGALGDLSVNSNYAVSDLSDFRSLQSFGYGLNWSPIAAINLIASLTNEEGAPTVEQLGAPQIVTPNVRVFDFVRGESIDITRIFGGNPDLRADDRQIVKLGLTVKPAAKTDLIITANYVRSRIDNPIASFPILTPDLEAAFPERFARDGNGTLLQIDNRAINFFRSRQEQLRWGANFTRPLGPVPPGLSTAKTIFVPNESSLQSVLPPRARIIKTEAGSAAARPFENLSSRLTLSLFHSFTFVDEIETRQNGPILDLLDGSAVGVRGGTSRHRVEFQAVAFKRGLGLRLTANWQSATIVRGLSVATGGLAEDLEFADIATFNLNVFADLGQRFGGAKAPGWLRGMRVSAGVSNLFNTRPSVRDGTGVTPIAFQPAILDPLGRLVNISVRKVF